MIAICLRFASIGKVNSFEFNGQNQFAEIEELMILRVAERNVLALASIFLFVKLFKFLRIFEQIGILLRVINKMLNSVFIFLIIYVVIVMGFAMAFHILIGEKIDSYRSWGHSM